MSWTLDKAREEVEACKARCRAAFSCGGHTDLRYVWNVVWGYHYEVSLLREAEARVRFIETQERANGAVNDNGAEKERA